MADPEVPSSILCLECGGRARLVSFPDEDGRFRPGDVVTYTCPGCNHRWDLVLPEDGDS